MFYIAFITGLFLLLPVVDVKLALTPQADVNLLTVQNPQSNKHKSGSNHVLKIQVKKIC